MKDGLFGNGEIGRTDSQPDRGESLTLFHFTHQQRNNNKIKQQQKTFQATRKHFKQQKKTKTRNAAHICRCDV